MFCFHRALGYDVKKVCWFVFRQVLFVAFFMIQQVKTSLKLLQCSLQSVICCLLKFKELFIHITVSDMLLTEI